MFETRLSQPLNLIHGVMISKHVVNSDSGSFSSSETSQMLYPVACVWRALPGDRLLRNDALCSRGSKMILQLTGASGFPHFGPLLGKIRRCLPWIKYKWNATTSWSSKYSLDKILGKQKHWHFRKDNSKDPTPTTMIAQGCIRDTWRSQIWPEPPYICLSRAPTRMDTLQASIGGGSSCLPESQEACLPKDHLVNSIPEVKTGRRGLSEEH